MSPSQLTRTLGALVLFAAGVIAAHAPSEVPDMILVNGRVFTGADTQPYAEAVAIKGTRILAVDTSEKISSLAGPNTRRIDVGGRLVIPGLNDVHTHFGLTPVPSVQGDPRGTMVDLGGQEPPCAQVLERLGQTARTAS